jgi:hypothetical protein
MERAHLLGVRRIQHERTRSHQNSLYRRNMGVSIDSIDMRILDYRKCATCG